jgi:hypothetical protein
MSRQKEEGRRLKARVEAITGEWYCMSGAHWATGTPLRRNGRKICEACSRRLAANCKTRRGSQ